MQRASGRRPRGECVAGGALARGASLLLIGLLAASAHASDIVVALDDARGSCRVHASFTALVPGAVAWDVLADYDGIGRFVSSVRASRMERQADGRLLLRQDAVGGVFLFRRRMQVLLELEEESGSRIHFRDVLGKDFRSYAGEWRITPDSRGTHVVYELEAEPKGAVARALCRGSLRSAARDLLTQVRAEMIRRAEAPR